MNSTRWLDHFQRNRLNRIEPIWDAPCEHVGSIARELARSLSHFQLGESGEGRFLLDHASRAYPGDPGYVAALALFIKEEQEHARLLARAVERFGGTLIHKHWTHFMFRLLRRALGVHFELQTLVIAELVGTAYYRLLARHSGDTALGQLCELVLRDESQHIAFHGDRFASNQAYWLPAEQALWAAQFQAVFVAAMHVAWLDHRAALAGLRVDRTAFLRESRAECIQFLASVSRAAAVGDHESTLAEAENGGQTGPTIT